MEPSFKTDVPKVNALPLKNIESINRDVFKRILVPMLSLNDLEALSLQNKKLKSMVQCFLDEAWKKRRAEITIGVGSWSSVGVAIKKVPPLPDNIDEILKSNCPYFEGERVYRTHKLVLMPGGLSINGQAGLMMHLRQENKKGDYSLLWDGISQELANKEVADPYWVLITKKVIPDSPHKSFKKQNELIERFKGYEAPSILEAIALVTMDNECSATKEEFLLPGTFTRCAEKVGAWQVSVGAFSLSGLRVNNYSGKHHDTGILAVRRLYTQDDSSFGLTG